jgi:recombinational DNA repair protein (RecF pathway)
MFSFDAIVLKKTQVKDSKNIISIFSKDYWRISVWLKESKNRSPVDIGNIYNFASKSENWINSIDSYKAKKVINSSGLSFREIKNILDICAYFEKILPVGMLHESIFNDYTESIWYLEDKNENNKAYLYFMLKFVKKLWIAKNPEWISWNNFKKIFSVIDIYPIETLMKIGGIADEDFKEIEKFNYETLNHYIN